MAATILDNAVTSIQVGVEDLRAGPKRTISAVRNLQAGVLLLLKAKLHQLSPPGSDEVLLKEHVVPRRAPDGTIHFVGSGSKTVDVETLLKRLQALEIDVDAGAIRKLTKERNNVEHYYTQMSDEALRALAASVLVVVRDFAKRHLQVEPLDLLGEATWTALLQHEAVHDAEHAAAVAARSKLSWPTTRLQDACEAFSCSKCGASLWRPVDGDDDFDCVSAPGRERGNLTNSAVRDRSTSSLPSAALTT